VSRGCGLYEPEEEVLTVAIRQAVSEHGHQDTPELRQQLKALLKDE